MSTAPTSGGTAITVNTGQEIIAQGLAAAQIASNVYSTNVNAATTMRGQDMDFAKSNASLAAQLQQTLAQIVEQAREADQRYELELKQYGLNVAQFNHQQRLTQLQARMQSVTLGLDVVKQRTETGMANYQQRAGVADKKLQIMDMLSKRRGPGDWVSYTSLMNMLNSPEALARGEIDPFAEITGDLYEPISDDLPSWANIDPTQGIDGLNQPFTADTSSSIPRGAGASESIIKNAMGSINSLQTPAQPAMPTPPAAPQLPAAGAGGAGAGGAVNINLPGTTQSANGQTQIPVYPPSTTPGQQFVPGVTAPVRQTGPNSVSYDGGTTTPPHSGFNTPGTPTWAQTGGMPTSATWSPEDLETYRRTRSTYETLASQNNPAAQSFREQMDRAVRERGGLPPGFAAGGRIADGENGDDVIGPVMVGDSVSGHPTGHEEAAMVKNPGPDTELQIQPMNPDGLEAQMGGMPPMGGLPMEDPMGGGMPPMEDPMMTGPDDGTQEKVGALIEVVQNALAQLSELIGGPPAAPPAPPGEEAMPTAAAGGRFTVRKAHMMKKRQPGKKPAGKKPPKQSGKTSADEAVASAKEQMPRAAWGGDFNVPSSAMAPQRPEQQQQTSSDYRPYSPAPQAQPGGMRMAAQPTMTTMPKQFRPLAPAPAPRQMFRNPVYNEPGQTLDFRLPRDAAMAHPSQFDTGWMDRYKMQIQKMRGAAPRPTDARQPMRASTGGTFTAGGQNTNADPLNVYNPGNTRPTVGWTQYSPQELGRQPFIGKLRGTTPSTQFTGFGANISNPDLGIDNMPSLISMQTWRDLSPTEKDMSTSLYEQGLGMDMRDILERSKRATPTGPADYGSWGVATYG